MHHSIKFIGQTSMTLIMRAFRLLLLSTVISAFVACSTVGNVMNPFYEDPAPEALLGNRNDHALNGEQSKGSTARAALEQMASYQAAQPPGPNRPVINPAVVRLMWVPDHVNSNGDLVPAHFYYLKVKKEDWAVRDAFELESQLGSRSGDASSVPYVPVK
jgi:hypothetical protein